MRLSAIVISKNEETRIKDCLDSLSFCDEVVVVDTGSTDKTVEIAKKAKANVFSLQSHDFAQMRNFGLKKAKGDWVLYVDADERVTKELAENIKAHIEDNGKFVAFKIKRKNFYYGNHEWPAIENIERLFYKKSLKEWYGELHESPLIEGEVGELSGYLLHYSHRNLSEMVKKTLEWSKIEAQLRFESGHPKMSWWRFPRVMIKAFYDSYVRQQGWKAGTIGIIESVYQSFSIFVTYARLWELQMENKKNE